MTDHELVRAERLIDSMLRLRVEGAGLLEKLLLDYKRLRAPMTSENIVDLARGLVESKIQDPPLRITVPAGTNLWEVADEGENMTLEQRLKDLSPDIKEVVVGKGKGLTVESVGQEQRVKAGG